MLNLSGIKPLLRYSESKKKKNETNKNYIRAIRAQSPQTQQTYYVSTRESNVNLIVFIFLFFGLIVPVKKPKSTNTAIVVKNAETRLFYCF